DALHRATVGTHPPGHHHIQLERPARIDAATVEVPADDARSEAGEEPAAVRRARPLRPAQVGRAGHADPAAAPFLPANPLLGVAAVFSIMPDRVLDALRVPPAAGVVDHARV